MGRRQGQIVSPRAPAAHGVLAGLELQAYPGEREREWAQRWHLRLHHRLARLPLAWNQACGLHTVVSLISWSSLGRDSPSRLLGRCPRGGQCLQGIPEKKQRAGVTRGDYIGKCEDHKSWRGTDLGLHLVLQGR